MTAVIDPTELTVTIAVAFLPVVDPANPTSDALYKYSVPPVPLPYPCPGRIEFLQF